MKTQQLFFSIVIPTLNEEKYLPKLLEDLSVQTFTNFEVIHIDGNSDDKTVEISQKFQSQLDLKIKTIKDRNVSKQRNLGSKLAKGNWLIFMDADNRLNQSFLSVLAKGLKSHQSDIFTCYMDNVNIPIADRPIMTLLNIWLKISSKIKPVAPGALLGLRNDPSFQLQFDENLFFAEDFEFVQDAVKKQLTFFIYDQPKYIYSLRRLKKDGSIKMIRVYSQSIINSFITGQKFTNPLKDYPMNGGSYYHSVPQISISKIQKLIETSSNAQLNKFKNLVKKFQNM